MVNNIYSLLFDDQNIDEKIARVLYNEGRLRWLGYRLCWVQKLSANMFQAYFSVKKAQEIQSCTIDQSFTTSEPPYFNEQLQGFQVPFYSDKFILAKGHRYYNNAKRRAKKHSPWLVYQNQAIYANTPFAKFYNLIVNSQGLVYVPLNAILAATRNPNSIITIEQKSLSCSNQLSNNIITNPSFAQKSSHQNSLHTDQAHLLSD